MSNTFRIAAPLALAFLAQACTDADVTGPFAISCTGHTEYEEPELPEIPRPEDGIETRVYIIDEERRDVAYFNPALGAVVSICEDSPELCQTSFHPNWISLQHRPEEGSSRFVAIDRVGGKLIDRLGGDMGFTFNGDCTKTAMPVPDNSAAF